MARFVRALSVESGLLKVPTSMTAIVPAAPSGSLVFAGIIATGFLTACIQINAIGWVIYVVETWKVTSLIVRPSHRRKGINHPRSYRWSTRPAIHHLYDMVNIPNLACKVRRGPTLS